MLRWYNGGRNSNRADQWFLSLIVALLSVNLHFLLFPVTVAGASPLLHNSNRFSCSLPDYSTRTDCENNGGTWSPSRKWGNGWGVSGQKYGEFACGTCHVRGPANGNIKRIRPSLTAPDGASFPSGAGEVVALQSISTVSSDFGNDAGGHVSSKRICEVCHSNTSYHRYDTTGQSSLQHFNGEDCIACHRHNAGFRAGCGDCHGDSGTGTAWPDGVANNINPSYAAFDDDAGPHAGHAAALGGNTSCSNCHPQVETSSVHLDGTVDLLTTGFTYEKSTQTCSSISCHGGTDATWRDGGACLDCHASVQGNRVAVKGQFSANSHHVQGVTVTNAHCYQCHWEANSDGTVNAAYHGRSATSTIDLVIYGAGTRPTAYTAGTTAITYIADGSRAEIAKLNQHCLGCHSNANNAATPFGDGKTPKQYAWDGTSVAARYSQSEITNWGKYPAVANAAQKIQTKAYSAHGNATGNQGGWSAGAATSGGTGVDGILPNTRNGTVNVACYDCHNSHGSSVSGKTTSYTSATVNGGLLKETTAGKSGYSVSYKPVAGGTAADKNQRNPGASLCMDCHYIASSGTTQPWGYQETYGASKQIIGYYDTPSFAPGMAGTKERYPYRGEANYKGGHFGASSPLQSPAMASIDGLCTPCHDPHGVSPTLGGNQQYGVPLLKGTWLTSPYKEDVAPRYNYFQTIFANDRYVYIDGTTFGSHIAQLVQGIGETDVQFGGLCLRCHPKASLTDGVTHTWKSKDRVHEAVKGWDTSGVTKHYFSCSKCHTPHIGSSLPRLMVTNCMDGIHKGRVANQSSPALSGSGACGSGRIPGNNVNCQGNWTPTYDTFVCHEEQNGYASGSTNQSWNLATPWAPSFYLTNPVPTVSSPTKSATAGKVRFNVNWGTNLTSDSAVDYGLTSGYGLTVANATLVTSHTMVLDGLDNHNTYHYRVRSKTSAGETVASVNQSYYISLPPTLGALITQPSQECETGPLYVTLAWNAAQDVDGGPIEYYAEVDDVTSFTSPNANSGWVTTTSATVGPLDCSKNWHWRIRARDANHTEAVSPWSSYSTFSLAPYPSGGPAAPALHDKPNFICGSNCSTTLSWSAVSNPYPSLYGAVQYYLEVDDDPAFASPDRNSGWITTTSTNITSLDSGKTWYFRVKARYANYPAEESAWSPYKQFTISYPPPSTPTALFTPDAVCTEACPVTLSWSASTAYNNGTVEYSVQVDDDPGFASINDSFSWTSGTSWSTGPLGLGTWYWRVQARDATYTTAVSSWSNTGTFQILATAPTSKDITFTWSNAPSNSIDIGGTLYGGTGSVVKTITTAFTAEIVGSPGQVGGGEPDPDWEYYATQAPGGSPGYIAAVFVPNNGNSFTIKVGTVGVYRATGGYGGGASYVAKDNSTVMYAAGGGGGGGGEASYWDPYYGYQEAGFNGEPGQGFGNATGGYGGAGGWPDAGQPGGNGGSGSAGVTSTTMTGGTSIPRVTITLN